VLAACGQALWFQSFFCQRMDFNFAGELENLSYFIQG
jgi:hypothetical protein